MQEVTTETKNKLKVKPLNKNKLKVAKVKKNVKPAIRKETVIKEVRWDLVALIADEKPENQQQIQIALETGYEPFAVSPHMVPPEKQDLLNINTPPQMKMANMLWLKRGTLVEIKNFEGAENVVDSNATDK
jgi:hypothetical protein